MQLSIKFFSTNEGVRDISSVKKSFRRMDSNDWSIESFYGTWYRTVACQGVPFSKTRGKTLLIRAPKWNERDVRSVRENEGEKRENGGVFFPRPGFRRHGLRQKEELALSVRTQSRTFPVRPSPCGGLYPSRKDIYHRTESARLRKMRGFVPCWRAALFFR